MSNLPWDDRPPQQQAAAVTIEVIRLRPGQEMTVCLLGPWKGLPHHWGERGQPSGPCLGPANRCPRCPDPRRFWEGYAPAGRWLRTLDAATGQADGVWQPIVCPVRAELAAELRQLRAGVRGLLLTIRRAAGPRRLHSWEVHDQDRPLKHRCDLEAFDVVPVLLRMWRLHFLPAAAAELFLSDDSAALEAARGKVR